MSKPLLVAYLMAGYPTIERSVECVRAAIDAGADVIELGVPFSDPVADGKTIQAAGEVALRNGMTLERAFDIVRELRGRVPIYIMSYLNPIYAYGIDRARKAAEDAGVHGFIIPDLTIDEPIDLPSVYFAASNASGERLRKIADATKYFIYALGLEGVTGEREHVSKSIAPFIARLRAVTAKPIAVGFGVSKREHFVELGKIADGVVVGSAVVRRMAESPKAVGDFIRELKSI